jgi:impB/mucB/samB family
MRRKLATLDEATRLRLDRKIEQATVRAESTRQLNRGIHDCSCGCYATVHILVMHTCSCLSCRGLSVHDTPQRLITHHFAFVHLSTLHYTTIATVCVVCDMDQFFAAVETRDRPELADKPVAVGGIGMISTANYVART